MKLREARTLLREIGFIVKASPVSTRKQLRRFQHGFAFQAQRTGFERPKATGLLTPKTQKALRYSANHGGACSHHFRFAEFACNGTPEQGAGQIKIHYKVVRGLERLRSDLGRPIGILSAYRTRRRNKAVGGSSKSQHRQGLGIDPKQMIPFDVLRAANEWSGIGIDQVTGHVQHFDKRHLGPWNFTLGRPKKPTIFYE